MISCSWSNNAKGKLRGRYGADRLINEIIATRSTPMTSSTWDVSLEGSYPIIGLRIQTESDYHRDGLPAIYESKHTSKASYTFSRRNFNEENAGWNNSEYAVSSVTV